MECATQQTVRGWQPANWPYVAALPISPVQDLDRPPGSFGTDLIVKIWDREVQVYRTVAGLRQPFVRCIDEAWAVVARAEDGAWRCLLSTRPQARIDIGGVGVFRSDAALSNIRRLARRRAVDRWRVRFPGGGTIDGRFAADLQHCVAHLSNERDLLLELSSSAPVSVSPA